MLNKCLFCFVSLRCIFVYSASPEPSKVHQLHSIRPGIESFLISHCVEDENFINCHILSSAILNPLHLQYTSLSNTLFLSLSLTSAVFCANAQTCSWWYMFVMECCWASCYHFHQYIFIQEYANCPICLMNYSAFYVLQKQVSLT